MARPKIDDARNKIYKIRLNKKEEKMLVETSEWTSQAKSEVIRNALLEYYLAAKERKTKYDADLKESGWPVDQISLKKVITCPYGDCGDDFSVDLADLSEVNESEGPMGNRCEYFFDTDEIKCPSCGRRIHVSGVISEYPVGSYEYEKINIEKDNK